MNKDEFIKRSKENLKRILKAEGLLDEKLELAFEKVPRELFFSESNRENAYLNNAFDIGYGQTISQPSMIFTMLKKLELNKSHRVLEVGTGSGYVTALLCELSHFVYSVEIIPELARLAIERLVKLGYTNYLVLVRDGSIGLPEYAPYDRIIVSAASPQIPNSLINQLSDNGIITIPIGGLELQRLMVVKKIYGNVKVFQDIPCRFVPLVGEEGFKEDAIKNYRIK
ncbi:MAG: protein-L-isoaspartate(D-aspartate) O-methyltransferase [Spirochaetes bacterium]|nr:protein-L-isoaspartate(D-aspartate) O-methyltransferase [Spirochaetota bacterium]